jgi:DNA-binding transcriptional LysR family regulator
MNYSIHQLQLFVKLTETCSITRTAEEMFMTQPAVSIQLKNLQNQFHFPLYEIIGKKVYITDLGWEVLEYAKRILAEIEELQFKTKQYDGTILGKLKISAASTGKYVIPYFLSEFTNMHSGVDLLLDVTNRTKVLESLKTNQTDFAIVSILPENLEVEEIELVENRLYLVGNAKSDSDSVLIFREQGSATRMEMEKFFNQTGRNYRKKMELTSNEAVKQAVVAGLGNSILPLIGLKNELLNKQVKIVSMKGLPITTKWRLIWLKEKKLTPVMKAYIEYVKSHKENILREHFDWYLKFK